MSLPHEPSAATERARMRIENLPDATRDADASERAVYISRRDTDVSGFTPEEVYQQGEVLWLGRVHHRDDVQVWGAHRAPAEPKA